MFTIHFGVPKSPYFWLETPNFHNSQPPNIQTTSLTHPNVYHYPPWPAWEHINSDPFSVIALDGLDHAVLDERRWTQPLEGWRISWDPWDEKQIISSGQMDVSPFPSIKQWLFRVVSRYLAKWFIIFHQPGFSWNKGNSLPERYLLGVFGRVRSL